MIQKPAKEIKIGVGILTGGRSKRMGMPKERVLIPWDGRSLLDRICDEMSFFSCRYLSVRKGQKPGRRDYIRVEDLDPDLGPIGGVYALLSACSCDALLILACDMPCYKKEDAMKMIKEYRGEDLLLYKSPSGREPLASIYHKNCLPLLRRRIREGNYRMNSLCEELANVRTVSGDGMACRNVNSPAEFPTIQMQES